jgi:XRE family transcriptional regulator, regulator of sulfur utilization
VYEVSSNAERPAEPVDIGPRLKEARQRHGLSLRALGERTGFSASFLSQVELGQTSPSLASLGRIAQALELSLGALLSEPSANGAPVIRRRDSGHKSQWSRATVRSLVPAGVDHRFTAVHVTLEAGGKSGKSPAVTSGQELAYCARGAVDFVLDGERHALEEGDSVFYGAEQRVQWRNPGKQRAELIFFHLRSR